MFKSFLCEFFTTETITWVPLFNVLEKILELIGYTAMIKSNISIRSKITCALKFVIVAMLLGFSLSSVLIEKNRELGFDSMLEVTGGFQALTKFLFLWLLKTKRQKLSRYVIEATSSLDTSSNESFKVIGKKYKMLSAKIMTTTLILYIMAAIVYNTLPLLVSDQWKLPIHSPIYGISYQSPPGYEINYFVIVVQMMLAICCFVTFDVLFYFYCLFTVQTFEVCKISCVYIGDKTGEHNTEEKQRQLIQNIVKLHSDAIGFLKDFKELFETTVLITISTYMVMICMFIVQIASDNQLRAYIPLLVAAFQLLLYSSFGQMIITKQEEFAEAIYCSKWYEIKDISTRKMVLLMLMNAQKCEGIRLKGFMELSLEAYCEMVKACYSFAAFLMNIL